MKYTTSKRTAMKRTAMNSMIQTAAADLMRHVMLSNPNFSHQVHDELLLKASGRRTIAIIGTRRRDTEADYKKVHNAFLKIYQEEDSIVSGGCKRGGDRFAERIAKTASIPITIHYPDLSKLDQQLMLINPRAAHARINYARNVLVAQDADIVLACVAPDRKGGTENTIKRFCKRLRASETELVQQGKLILI